MAHRTRTMLAVGFLTALAGANSASGQENVIGSEIYLTNCASCHGTSGQGDGEVAKFLTVKPADLTKITADNGGVFPFLQILQYVDGRTMVGAHGDRGMPVWGDVFTRSLEDLGGPYGTELLVRARLVAVVDYIESLQQP